MSGVPYVFATMSAGNVPASDLDADFKVCINGTNINAVAGDMTSAFNAAATAAGIGGIINIQPGTYSILGTVTVLDGQVWNGGNSDAVTINAPASTITFKWEPSGYGTRNSEKYRFRGKTSCSGS